MNEPEKKLDMDLGQVDAINNLDTARMTLRWALERIHGVEKEKIEAASGLDKARRDILDLQKSLARRAEEANERELYYAKMEELISLHLAGKLNVAALVRQQAETTQLQQFLLEKQTLIDREFESRKEQLEAEYQRLMEDKEQKARAQAQAFENSQKELRLTLEKEHASRLVALHEGEVRLKQQEKVLVERAAQFEIFYKTQRAALETDIQRFREDVDDQVRFRIEGTERLLLEKHAVAEAAWAKEKTLLLQDLSAWRQTGQEQTALGLELEKRMRQADREVQRLAADAASKESAWAREKTLLLEDLNRWRQTAQEQVSRLIELENRLAQASAEGQRLSLNLSREEQARAQLEVREEENRLRLIDAQEKAGRAQEALSFQEERRKNFEETKKAMEQRIAEISVLERRLAMAEEGGEAASAALAYESELRRSLESKLAEQAKLLTQWQDKAAAGRVSQDEAARAKALAESREEAYSTRLSELALKEQELDAKLRQTEEERLALTLERARGSQERRGLEMHGEKLEAAQQARLRDHQESVLDLEKRLAGAEESAHQAIASLALEQERRKAAEARENAVAAEHRARLSDLEARLREKEATLLGSFEDVDRRREVIVGKQQAQLLDLEKRLAEADEERQSLALELAREAERRAILEDAKGGLDARLRDLQGRLEDGPGDASSAYVEKRLAEARKLEEAAEAREAEAQRRLEQVAKTEQELNALAQSLEAMSQALEKERSEPQE